MSKDANNSHSLSAYIKPLLDAGAEVFEVGGSVRDLLLGKPSKDHDCLCRLLPIDRLVSVLKPFGKVSAVGKSFGVIKFSPHRAKAIEIDIALPRKERSTGQGHRDFDVDFDPALAVEADLARRDFTVNAMALSIPDGRLVDPFGGKIDLEARLLRMVFPRAFEDDPLRLIRGVQFAARLGFKFEDVTWEAMKRDAPLISTVSGERIAMELEKLFRANAPSKGFDLMFESGLLKEVLPEVQAIKGIEQDKAPSDDVYGHTMRALDAYCSDPLIENMRDLTLAFAILLHDIGKAKTERYHSPSQRIVFFGHQLASARMARRTAERLKLASVGVNLEELDVLIKNHMFETKARFTDRAIRRFVAKVSKELIFKLLDLRFADNRGGKHPTGIKGVLNLRKRIRDELAKKPPFGPKDLAVNGHDLIGLGIPEGPQLGQIIKFFVGTVLDDPALNTREQLLALAERIKQYPEVLKTEAPDGKED